MSAKQCLLRRFVLGEGGDQVCNIDEVFVVQILRDTVAAPCATAHAKREVERIVETAAVSKSMGLVNQYSHDIDLLREPLSVPHV